MQHDLCFFLHALKVPHIVYHSVHRHFSDEKKVHEQVVIKITSVGMGAAKSRYVYRNGNVGEFRHMTTSFFSTCLIMIKSDSVQDSFWSNHKDVSNSITYEHLRQLPLNNEPRSYRSTSRDFHNLKKMK